MLRAFAETAAGGDRDLKDTAVVVMDPSARRRGMLVLAGMAVMRARDEPRQFVEKSPQASRTGGQPQRFVAEAAFDVGIVPVIGEADAGRDPYRCLE
jgi:hypothetical protein